MASTASSGARGTSMSIGNRGFDSVAPVISAFTIPATDTDYVITVSSFTVTDKRASDDEETTYAYMITMSATAPKCDAVGWLTTKPTSYTIPVASQAGTGTYTLYAWAKDRAGNVSAAVSDSIALTIS